MEENQLARTLPEATVQEIQLELIRRTRFDAFDGERVVADLLAHRDLWTAAMMDRFCFSRPGKLPSIGLIKLRDLADNFWNVDTLYVLTPDGKTASQLAQIADNWGGEARVHDAVDEVEEALGAYGMEAAVVSVWWD